MSLYEKINNDLKEAMKAKDELKLSVLRMFLAALKNKKIELSGATGPELNDAQIIDIAGTEIKKRKDSVAIYEQGNRPELADKEKKEITLLENYLPAQATDEEIESVVKEIITAQGEAKNFGQVMGQAMGKLKGKADGNKVSEMVKKLLS